MQFTKQRKLFYMEIVAIIYDTSVFKKKIDIERQSLEYNRMYSVRKGWHSCQGVSRTVSMSHRSTLPNTAHHLQPERSLRLPEAATSL